MRGKRTRDRGRVFCCFRPGELAASYRYLSQGNLGANWCTQLGPLLAKGKRTHRAPQPLPGGGLPRHTEDAPPLAARVPHLDCSLRRELGGGDAEGGDRGDGAGSIGNATRSLFLRDSFQRKRFSCGSNCLPRESPAPPPPHPSSPPLRPAPDCPGGASRKLGAVSGAPPPCPGLGTAITCAWRGPQERTDASFGSPGCCV